jgi:acyl-CoA thioesterase II
VEHTAEQTRPWTQDEMLRLMDAQPQGEGVFTAPAHGPTARDVVEAGQMLGATVVAAAKQVPHQRVVSASMIFSRAAAHSQPLTVHLDPVRTGRTFSTLEAQVRQQDTQRCSGVVLLDADADDLIRGAIAMPDVDPPDRLRSHSVPGAVVDGRDIRVVDDAYDHDPDRIGPPELFVWTRFRDAPAHEYLHQALLTQSTTHWTVAAAMRPHSGIGESMAHRSISTGITMTTVTFHDTADVSQWLLYATRATYAGRGQAQSDGHVFDADGRLVASYSVHAMIRGLLARNGATSGGDTLL